MFPLHCSIKIILFAWWKVRLLVRVTGIRLENWLMAYWGLGTRSGQAQVYSLTAITGNKKLTPVTHCLHLHLGKTEINQLQSSIKACRQNMKKTCATLRSTLYQIKSHSKLLSSGIRKERRRNCPGHAPELYLMQDSCKFLHVQNQNSNFWKK